MCRMCEGFSLEDTLALDAAAIAEYGFIVIGVVGSAGDDDDPAAWMYTVGLLDSADHPELIMAGVPPTAGSPVMSELARSVLDDGDRYEVGDTIDLGRGVARVGAVHAIQYRLDTFNTWHNLSDIGALRAPELSAVQIVMPRVRGSNRRYRQPLLSDPGARV